MNIFKKKNHVFGSFQLNLELSSKVKKSVTSLLVFVFSFGTVYVHISKYISAVFSMANSVQSVLHSPKMLMNGEEMSFDSFLLRKT